MTAFLHACNNGRVKVIEVFLDPEFFNVAKVMNASHSAFILAYNEKQTEVMSMLVPHLTNLDEFIHVFESACKSNDTSTVTTLLSWTSHHENLKDLKEPIVTYTFQYGTLQQGNTILEDDNFNDVI